MLPSSIHPPSISRPQYRRRPHLPQQQQWEPGTGTLAGTLPGASHLPTARCARCTRGPRRVTSASTTPLFSLRPCARFKSFGMPRRPLC